MPKAILEFNLPEEREDFDLAMNAVKLFCQKEDFYQWIRGLNKYSDQETIKIEEVFKKFNEVFSE